MPLLNRREGEEQPYWRAGAFKIRLPFIHYKWEWIEAVQALFLFVVSLAMIPLLEEYLGLPYEAALAFVFVCGIGFLLPSHLGVPYVAGWITPAIPVVLLFLKKFEPGAEAIQALFGLQIIVAVIFLLLGITKLSRKIVQKIPQSIKSGILLGAGISAILGEIGLGEGRFLQTPISIGIGSVISFITLFSIFFIQFRKHNKIAEVIAQYGILPALIVSIFIGVISKEYSWPSIEVGINLPKFRLMWDYLPFTVGFPSVNFLVRAIPTAITAYIIAFGDVIVATTLVKDSSDKYRKDEKVDTDPNRLHLTTAMRNIIHAFFAPYPGLAGPIWTAVTATVADRYKSGRKAMDSIFGGAGTFWITGFIALFILPLVSFFKPFLPLGLSLTMIITGYLCITTAFKQIKEPIQMGVATIMAIVLATHGAALGLGIGIALHFILERQYIMTKVTEE